MRRDTFETPGELTLDVRMPQGRVQIETHDGTTTEVVLDAGEGDYAAELLESSRIEQRGDEVIVSVREKKRFGLAFHSVGVDVQIRAPHGARLRLDTASADVRARGRLGAVDANTASGDVELDEISGDARLNTASGDVEIGRVAGNLKVNSASGEVRVHDAGAAVEISTASGDQRIDAVVSGTVRLQAASGDITVGIRKGSSVAVDARSLSGDTSSEVELGDTPIGGAEGPLVELKAMSMSGDVAVTRAPAPTGLRA